MNTPDANKRLKRYDDTNKSHLGLERKLCRLLHLAPRAGRGRLASGALAKRSKSGEGACPQAQTRGSAPPPRFLRSPWNPTSPRPRGEGAQVAPPRAPTTGAGE